jgi:VWFA-related protein
MRRFTTLPMAALLCIGGGALSAQQASSGIPLPAADPVIHVSVNLVQVDAVVTDSEGHHVSDLAPGDFGILEDRKPQKITNFSWIALTPAAQSSPNGVGTQASKILRKEDVRRSIVLMVDDGSLDTQGMQAVTKAARGFVANQLSPGDLAAITASRGGMGIYQQFTSDKQQLNAAIDHLGQRWAGLGIPFAVDAPAWVTAMTGETPIAPASWST